MTYNWEGSWHWKVIIVVYLQIHISDVLRLPKIGRTNQALQTIISAYMLIPERCTCRCWSGGFPERRKASLSAVYMMNESRTCWLMIRKLWKTVAHATIKPWNSSRGQDVRTWRPQRLLTLSLGHIAACFFCSPRPALLHIRSFWSFCLDLLVEQPQFEPQMFPSAVSNEWLVGLRKLYPAPTMRSMEALASDVMEPVQLPHVSNHRWQIWTSCSPTID